MNIMYCNIKSVLNILCMYKIRLMQIAKTSNAMSNEKMISEHCNYCYARDIIVKYLILKLINVNYNVVRPTIFNIDG